MVIGTYIVQGWSKSDPAGRGKWATWTEESEIWVCREEEWRGLKTIEIIFKVIILDTWRLFCAKNIFPIISQLSATFRFFHATTSCRKDWKKNYTYMYSNVGFLVPLEAAFWNLSMVQKSFWCAKMCIFLLLKWIGTHVLATIDGVWKGFWQMWQQRSWSSRLIWNLALKLQKTSVSIIWLAKHFFNFGSIWRVSRFNFAPIIFPFKIATRSTDLLLPKSAPKAKFLSTL